MQTKFNIGDEVFVGKFNIISTEKGERTGNFAISVSIEKAKIKYIRIDDDSNIIYIFDRLINSYTSETKEEGVFSTAEEAQATIKKNILNSFVKFIEEN